jgi:prophage regulatory protein
LEVSKMVRSILRKSDVLKVTGWSNSTLYTKMAEGKFPRPTKLDPDGRVVFWFEDEIAELQKLAVERQAAAA